MNYCIRFTTLYWDGSCLCLGSPFYKHLHTTSAANLWILWILFHNL